MTRSLYITRTPAQVRAAAALLDGTRARAAVATTETSAPAEPSGSVGELWLYGVVGGWWRGFDAESVSNALRGLDVDVLYVRIHSPGGSASDGVAIANLLRNHRARVVTVVDGIAASAASVIAGAGDEVVMCPGSQMMLHDASTYGAGNAADLRRAADWVDGQSDNYASVYAYRAGGTAAAWREVMLANDGWGTWYTADAAVAAKLADSVGTRPAYGSPPVDPGDDFEDEETLAKVAHDLALLDQCVHPAARAAWAGEKPSAPKPPSASAVGSNHTEGGSAVAFSDEQLTTMRQQLGLPETADETTIVAALSEALTERAEGTDTSGVPEGHVAIPAARLSDLEAGAAAGLAAQKALHDKEREDFLNLQRAKYAPANRAAWSQEYDRNPQGTREHFAQAPDLVPVTEIGHSAADADTGSDDLESVRNSDAYKNWK